MRVPSCLLPALPLLLLGCSPPTHMEQGTARAQQAIVGGSESSGDPAVVILTADGAFSFCSGTLITPDVILTAAHCIDVFGPDATYEAFFGNEVSVPERRVRVVEQRAHPEHDAAAFLHDVGLMRLEAPVEGVTPVPLHRAPLDLSVEGSAIRHVGWGLHVAGSDEGSGIKRTADTTIDALFLEQILYGPGDGQVCNGDSGGAALMAFEGGTEELVGVIIAGTPDCQEAGVDARLDVELPFVDATLEDWAPASCEEDGQCAQGCAQVDVDCVCAADGQCTAACPDVTKDADCPAACAADGVCSREPCPVPDVDCVPEGQACTRNVQCVQRLCAPVDASGRRVCARPCGSDAACGEGEVCTAGACHAVSAPAGEGEACGAETPCAEGLECRAGSGGGQVCQRPVMVEPPTPQARGCTSAPGGSLVGLGLLLLLGLARRAASPSPSGRGPG